MHEVQRFRDHVLDESNDNSNPELLLATAHQVKGMQMRHVQIGGDMVGPGVWMAKTLANGDIDVWFDHAKFSDSLNLLYVACTRSMVTLSLPANIAALFADFAKLSATQGGSARKRALDADGSPEAGSSSQGSSSSSASSGITLGYGNDARTFTQEQAGALRSQLYDNWMSHPATGPAMVFSDVVFEQ